MTYALTITIDAPLDNAESRVREALSRNGFGVLTEIDLAATLHDKIGIDIEPHRILGVCRPKLAAEALDAEPDVSLLLPCTVALREHDARTTVAVLDPHTMVTLTGNPALDSVAADARRRLDDVLRQLQQ